MTRTRSQVGRYSRNKGKRFEREVSTAFKEYLTRHGVDVHRALQSERARESDVIVPGLWLECKAGPMKSLRSRLADADLQARRDAKAHGGRYLPVVVYKYDFLTSVARLRLRDLLKLWPNGSGPSVKADQATVVEIPFADFVRMAVPYVLIIFKHQRDQERAIRALKKKKAPRP